MPRGKDMMTMTKALQSVSRPDSRATRKTSDEAYDIRPEKREKQELMKRRSTPVMMNLSKRKKKKRKKEEKRPFV